MSTHYTAGQRRALNQIWNGAGAYGFDPLFLSLNSSGDPNLYFNTVAGCVRKWYGDTDPARLFGRWAGDRRQTLLDDLAWLALENAVYQKELPQRPILAGLRRDWAENFFDQEHTLSRQEWMSKNQLSYTIQAARWKTVLGSRLPLMTPYEKRLSAALALDPLEGAELFPAILDIFSRFHLFNGKSRPPHAMRFHLTGQWSGLMTRLVPSEIIHTDVASAGTGNRMEAGDSPRIDTRRARIRMKEGSGSDRRYIESCFGPSLLSARELAAAEQKLCTGVHQGCHLWYASGVPAPEQAPGGEARLLARQAQLQCEQNQTAFGTDSALYQNLIRRLAGQIQNCLQIHSRTEEQTARSGQLDCRRAWRAFVLSDQRVFTREMDTAVPGFTVDLLLDASSSRMHCQEAIAAQGYILSESLTRCGVLVRVSGFCSLRGYTVLRTLKDFRDNSRKIFRYFAVGWNRDGLALRAAGELLEVPPEWKRLILLLTDASPNDSRRIPPGEGHPFGHDYSGSPAVEDSARQVRVLRGKGIRVGAVFMGPEMNLDAARTIYGKNLASIRSIDQLAQAAGRLIQDEIQELE